MRRIVALALTATALAACGASAASTQAKPLRIVFGIAGGNLAPFQVTIDTSGRVRTTGSVRPHRRRLSRARVRSLSRLVRQAFAGGLASRQCPGTNPDIGSDFIRATGRTVTVHGRCEPGFQKLWNELAQAVGLGLG